MEAKAGFSRWARQAIAKGYLVSLIRFASDACVSTGPTGNGTRFEDALRSLEARGSTDLARAIHLAMDLAPRSACRRAIVLFTDGMPDDEDAAVSAAAAAAARGFDLIAFGTSHADERFLRRIASRADLAIPVSAGGIPRAIESSVKLLPGLKPMPEEK